MTYIPNCREDEYYHESNLNDKNKLFVEGYDWAVERIMNLFDNLDVYPELNMILDDHTAIVKEGKADIAKGCVEDWAEMSRNELITSMIEGQ